MHARAALPAPEYSLWRRRLWPAVCVAAPFVACCPQPGRHLLEASLAACLGGRRCVLLPCCPAARRGGSGGIREWSDCFLVQTTVPFLLLAGAAAAAFGTGRTCCSHSCAAEWPSLTLPGSRLSICSATAAVRVAGRRQGQHKAAPGTAQAVFCGGLRQRPCPPHLPVTRICCCSIANNHHHYIAGTWWGRRSRPWALATTPQLPTSGGVE